MRTSLDWIRLDGVGLEGVGLEWIGLDWFGVGFGGDRGKPSHGSAREEPHGWAGCLSDISLKLQIRAAV